MKIEVQLGVILLYKSSYGTITVLEEVISPDRLTEFLYVNRKSKVVLNTTTLINIFEYFYDIDINDYSFSSMSVKSPTVDYPISVVSLYLKERDFVKIQRENKINSLLKNN